MKTSISNTMSLLPFLVLCFGGATLSITVDKCPTLPEVDLFSNLNRPLIAISDKYDDWDTFKELFPLNANCYVPNVVISINNYVYQHSNFTLQQYRNGEFLIISRCLKKGDAYDLIALLIFEGNPPTPTKPEVNPVINEYLRDILKINPNSENQWNGNFSEIFCPSHQHTPSEYSTNDLKTTENPAIGIKSRYGTEENSWGQEKFRFSPWVLYPIALISIVVSSITIYLCYAH